MVYLGINQDKKNCCGYTIGRPNGIQQSTGSWGQVLAINDSWIGFCLAKKWYHRVNLEDTFIVSSDTDFKESESVKNK